MIRWQSRVGKKAKYSQAQRKEQSCILLAFGCELATIRVSRNPTLVKIVNGVVQTNEDAALYVYIWSNTWQYRSWRLRQKFYRLKNSAKIMDISMIGPEIKKHILFKTAYTENYVLVVVPSLSTGPSGAPTSTSSTSESQDSMRDDSTPSAEEKNAVEHREISCESPPGPKTKIKMRTSAGLHNLPEWLEEFTEHVVDGEASA